MFVFIFVEITAVYVYRVFDNIADNNMRITFVENFKSKASQQRGLFSPFLKNVVKN